MRDALVYHYEAAERGGEGTMAWRTTALTTELFVVLATVTCVSIGGPLGVSAKLRCTL
jgi:hypothetical protein